MRNVAHSLGIIHLKLAAYHGVNVPQHGIITKGAHSGAVDGFHTGFEPGLYHGLRRMAVRRPDTLPEAVVKRVIQIENHATDQRCLYT